MSGRASAWTRLFVAVVSVVAAVACEQATRRAPWTSVTGHGLPVQESPKPPRAAPPQPTAWQLDSEADVTTPAGWARPSFSPALADRKREHHPASGWWFSEHPPQPVVEAAAIDYEALPVVDGEWHTARSSDPQPSAGHELLPEAGKVAPGAPRVLPTDDLAPEVLRTATRYDSDSSRWVEYRRLEEAFASGESFSLHLTVPGNHIGSISSGDFLVARFIEGVGALTVDAGPGAPALRPLEWSWLSRQADGSLRFHAARGWLDGTTGRVHVAQRLESALREVLPSTVYAFRLRPARGTEQLHVIAPAGSSFVTVAPFRHEVLVSRVEPDTRSRSNLTLELDGTATELFSTLVPGARQRRGHSIEVQLSQTVSESKPALLVTCTRAPSRF